VPGTVNLEVSYEELPQLSFDEFSDDYVIPMPFEDEYSHGHLMRIDSAGL